MTPGSPEPQMQSLMAPPRLPPPRRARPPPLMHADFGWCHQLAESERLWAFDQRLPDQQPIPSWPQFPAPEFRPFLAPGSRCVSLSCEPGFDASRKLLKAV